MTNFCLFKKRLENVKSIRTLKQDRSKAKPSLKSVLSLQVNINIPKIEKDHQKKLFGNNRHKRRLCLEELSEKHQKKSLETSSKKSLICPHT